MSQQPSPVRLALTLGVAGVLSGLVIVSVHQWTEPIIEANRAAELREAVKEVLKGTATMKRMVPGAEMLVEEEGQGGEAVYAGYDEEGKRLGFAVPAEGPGFQDTIRLIYGFDPKTDRIIGFRVLESKETPGLGDKIYKDAAFVAQFDDLGTTPKVVAVKPGEKAASNEIDAISGATISSKAVVSIINASLSTWRERLKGVK